MILTMRNLSLKLTLNLMHLDLELELQDMEPGEVEMRIFGVTSVRLTAIQLNLAPIVDLQLVHHYNLWLHPYDLHHLKFVHIVVDLMLQINVQLILVLRIQLDQ
jgi:hypothetical protein